MRGSVPGRQVWQGFLDWLRPSDRAGGLPAHALGSAHRSIRPVRPVSSTGLSSTAERAIEMFADEEIKEIDPDELLDFLAADHDPIAADPAFREKLREELWALVEMGAFKRPPDH